MRYYVIFPTGQRYGPADLRTLQLWVAENRVGPATTLMEETTGRSFPAADLSSLGLAPYAGPTSAQPGQPYYAPYYRSYPARSSSGTNVETTLAWIFGGVGFCIPLLSIAGIVLAAIGMRKGQRGAGGALALSIVTLLLNIFMRVLVFSI